MCLMLDDTWACTGMRPARLMIFIIVCMSMIIGALEIPRPMQKHHHRWRLLAAVAEVASKRTERDSSQHSMHIKRDCRELLRLIRQKQQQYRSINCIDDQNIPC